MRIEIRGRNVEVTDDLREQVAQKFKRIGQQLIAVLPDRNFARRVCILRGVASAWCLGYDRRVVLSPGLSPRTKIHGHR